MLIEPEERSSMGDDDLRTSAGASTRYRWLWRLPVQMGLILVIGMAIYGHTLQAKFTLDDTYCIEENPAIRDFGFLFDLDRVRELPIPEDIKNNIALRVVAYWTFAFNYRFGALNEYGYHLVNIGVHLLNALLVYLLVRATLRCVPLNWRHNGAASVADFVPLLVALLFVSHPLQTQAVTYLSQRFSSLLTLFYLGALLCYVNARVTWQPVRRWFCYGLALLATVLAMKTQESAFTLPFTLFFYEFCFFRGAWRRRLLWLLPFAVTLPIIPGALFRLVTAAGSVTISGKLEDSVNLVNFNGISQWTYLKTQFGAVTTYLQMFLLPINQNIIPDFPVAHNFFTVRTFGSFLLLGALFLGASYLVWSHFRRRSNPSQLLIGFGVLWFFTTISMSSSVIPLVLMLQEYRVYLPSYGFFLAVVVALGSAVDKGWGSPRTFGGLAVLAIALLCAATVVRNDLYNDRVTLMRDILRKNPGATSARVTLAASLLERNLFEEAEAELINLLEVLPEDANMITNLGYVLEKTGRFEAAIEQYAKALSIDPGNPYAHGQLGTAYRRQKQFGLAERELRIALAADPYIGFARWELASLYEEQGRLAEAVEQYRLLLQSYPGDTATQDKLRRLLNR